MVVELTQQDLKKAKESLKAMSREKCRQYLDSIYMNFRIFHNQSVVFYNCTKENSLSFWHCQKQLIEANNCVKQ